MKRMHRGLAILGAGAFLALPSLSTTPLAFADTIECTQPVVDTTNDNVLDVGAVENAVENARQFGADVYVRAFQNTPGGNADVFWAQGLKQCSNWRTPDGNAKSNVIILVLGMDKQSAIFLNTRHYPALYQRADAIRAEDMNANFRAGDFTLGMTSALDSITRTLDPAAPPMATYEQSTIAKPATDYSGFWRVLKWILVGIVGICMFVAAIVGSTKLVRHMRQTRTDRLAAQSQAQEAKGRADNAITNYDGRQETNHLFLLAVAGLPDSMAAPHQKEMKSILDLYDSANDSYMSLYNSPVADPKKRLTTEQYAELARDYTAVGDTFAEADEKLTQLYAAIEQDKEMLTLPYRENLANELDRDISQLSMHVDRYGSAFDVSEQAKVIETLTSDLASLRKQLHNETKALVSCNGLHALKGRVDSLRNKLNQFDSSYSKITGARKLVSKAADARRKTLVALEHVETVSAVRELDATVNTSSSLFRELGADKSREAQIEAIDHLIGRINTAGSDAVAENKRIIDKQRAKREEAEAEERRARRRSSSSSSSSFGGGFAGGYIGSSFGGSSSSGGFDGGGSSGGWGGGGGFDGGGSSGGW